LSAIRTLHDRVKILAQGTLTLKNLKFSGVSFSVGAREQIEKNGGSIS
jgi:ribosomal protein L15